MRDWPWFRILVYINKMINLIKDFNQSFGKAKGEQIWRSLNLPWEIFHSVWTIFWLYFKENKSEAMYFNFMVNFWTTVDEKGGMTWTVTKDKISISYYLNDENINLENILFILNNFAFTYWLDAQGWKLSFTMTVSHSEHWNYDYFKRIEFICRKCFFVF